MYPYFVCFVIAPQIPVFIRGHPQPLVNIRLLPVCRFSCPGLFRSWDAGIYFSIVFPLYVTSNVTRVVRAKPWILEILISSLHAPPEKT